MTSLLRIRLNDELKSSVQSKNLIRTSTIRLILAALKDRDISARSKGNTEGISDEEILSLLQTMVKQRNESVSMYEQGNRPDLVQREKEEIEVIYDFMPRQLSADEVGEAVDEAVDEVKAESVKDMGKVMAYLKEHYAGKLDFSLASQKVKQKLL
tara:strand:- start:30 stop:494 length:465 start_codon:yes stop_codon:yes gene_type:complete